MTLNHVEGLFSGLKNEWGPEREAVIMGRFVVAGRVHGRRVTEEVHLGFWGVVR